MMRYEAWNQDTASYALCHNFAPKLKPSVPVPVCVSTCCELCIGLSHLISDINSKDSYCRMFVCSQSSQSNVCTTAIKYS